MTALEPTIAEQINEKYNVAQSNASRARIASSDAITAAWECGQLLNQQKKKTKSDWLLWLECNCPAISKNTAFRYMALAVAYPTMESLISENKQLTDMYRAAGILPEKTVAIREPQSSAIGSPAPYLTHLGHLMQYFNDYDPTTAPESTRYIIKQQLEPLHALYLKL